MSDDKPKPPLPDEDDWESALDAWETVDVSAPPPPVAPAVDHVPARSTSTTTTARGMPIARGPLYHPPPEAPSTLPPPMGDAELASLHAYDDDEDDERTIVGRISPELLADASEGRPNTGSGLGQVFRRAANPPPLPAPHAPALPSRTGTGGPAPSSSPGDALLELLFDDPAALTSEDEPSVITSAPRILPNEGGVSDDERGRSEAHDDAVPEGELFDPFAPSAPADRPASPSGDAAPPVPPTLAADDPWNALPATPRPIDISEATPAPPVEPPGGSADEHTVAVRMRAPSREGGASPSPPPARAAARSSLDTVSDEHAPALLATPEQRDVWWARAAWLEEEARASDDRAVCARGLLISSELLSLIDEPARSHDLATEARELSPGHPLAQRQSRALAMREGDWGALASAIQAEGRSAATPAARVHGAILASEIARVGQGDEELANQRLEQAMRADPTDPRAYLNRVAGALAAGDPLPRLRFPELAARGERAHTTELAARGERAHTTEEGEPLRPLVEAFAAVQRWHGSAPDKPDAAGPVNAIDLLIRARATLRGRDARAAVAALDALGAHVHLREASSWLSLGLVMTEPSLVAEVAPRLSALAHGPLAPLAQRAMVGRALATGDRDEALAVVNRARDDFAPADRLAIALLAGADTAQVGSWTSDAHGASASFARAVQAVLFDAGQLPASEAGDDAGALTLRLGRRIAAHAPAAELAPLVDALGRHASAWPVAEVLSSELDLEMGRLDALAAGLATVRDDAREQPGRALVAALLFELTLHGDRARELYAAALLSSPGCESALRATLALASRAAHAPLLIEQHDKLQDPRASALMLVEAAHVALAEGELDQARELLQRAHERAPSLPFASWLSERRVRAQGDFDAIIWWLRERRQASHDPVERAFDLVREALLVADRDREGSRELLRRASDARPRDLALRELYERLAPVAHAEKAPYWAERAREASGEARARLALHAAYEYEMANDPEQAAQLAQLSLAELDTPFARLCRERNEARSSFATHLADRLLQEARSTEDVRTRVEAYERLAELDERSRGDLTSAVLWHRSILEEQPGHLASLSRLFHWLVTEGREGREEELEAVLAELAQALQGREAAAHAYVAARLRTRSGPWVAGAPYVRLAFAGPAPSLWAVREMDAHAVVANDAPAELSATRRLLGLTQRPLEVATLALRAADAADRAGNATLALELLTDACRAYPSHLVAVRALAELAERLGDGTLAGEQWDVVSTLVRAPEHRLEATYRAGVAWLDSDRDPDRGRAALEEARRVDITYRDLFARLRELYVKAGDRPALAALLEARLAKVASEDERIELEIARGRTLAEIGDAAAAKRALSLALDQSPEHPDALRIYADICAAEGDWSGAEQALIRLSRLVPDASAQALVYMQLGELYSDRQPNVERAELAYREVLKRSPDDVAARERLIALYANHNRPADAIELAQELVRTAALPEAKRQRTVELALLHERAANDRKRGEALLEAARKEAPHDVDLLAALVEMYARGDRLAAAQALLDRAAGDARRALSTGRFDVSLFATVAGVARLRGRAHAAQAAEATVLAMEGRGGVLSGAGAQAAAPDLDDQVAPELLSRALRTLLHRSGHLLDAVSPVDLSALRAAALSPGLPAHHELTALAEAMGVAGVELFLAPMLGGVCIPASSDPPRLVLGGPLLAGDVEPVRRFLAIRALKIVQGRASALARSAPIDLLPMVSAFLLLFAPDWQPGTVDTGKLDEMRARLGRAGQVAPDPNHAALALEVIGGLGNRTSTLHTIVNGWGNRVALLATGDLSLAFAAIARSAGHAAGPAPQGPERITWIGRNAEARDLALFAASDAYAELRAKLGLTT